MGGSLFIELKYKKYFRKTSLKQKNIGDLFLKEIQKSNPKSFLEIGVFHGVTARNVCELLHTIHGENFKYIGLDLFEINDENKSEIIPSNIFSFEIFFLVSKCITCSSAWTPASVLPATTVFIFSQKNLPAAFSKVSCTELLFFCFC